MHVDNASERAGRQIGRPRLVQSFRKPVIEILLQKPDLPSLEIFAASA
jgi:hypothetical protein